MFPQDILDVWFVEHGPDDWFKSSVAFDALLRERFGQVYDAAARGETANWRTTPDGRLAEIILLDQFSRNLFRGTPQAYAQDDRALTLAHEAVAAGDDARVEPLRRQFFYMPYMHAESLDVQDEGVRLFEVLGNPHALTYARAHRDIIARFGRFPHRNATLGRISTSEEVAFLQNHAGF